MTSSDVKICRTLEKYLATMSWMAKSPRCRRKSVDNIWSCLKSSTR